MISQNPPSNPLSILLEVKEVENVKKFIDGMNILKEIYVPNKLVNLVVK